MEKKTMSQDRFEMILEILDAREVEIDKKMKELRAIEARIRSMSAAFLKVIQNPGFAGAVKQAQQTQFEEE